MKISCNIIRDLLPLYVEDMVSDDSRKMVDAHLCQCDACAQVLTDMKKDTALPAETETESLDKVRKMILRRRILCAIASVFTLLTILSLVVTWFITPFQLTAEEAIEDFYVQEDGTVIIDYAPYVVGRHQSGVNENWFILLHSTRYDMLKAKYRPSMEELYGEDGTITEEERLRYENIDVRKSVGEILDSKGNVVVQRNTVDWNWWYADPSGASEATLLYDAGKPKESPTVTISIYPAVFAVSLLVGITVYILSRVSKKKWQKELFMRLTIALACEAFSVLFVSSGRLQTSYIGVIDQNWGPMIGANAVFLTLTVLFWRQLYLENQQDKVAVK